jgi:hypothetical protein
MAVDHTLQLLQDRPELTANSPQFRELGLGDDQCRQLAYQLIDSYPFIGQTVTVYNSKGVASQTMPVNETRANSIKKYLKAFIDVDRTALETCFQDLDAADAKRSMVNEIIDKRKELLLVYTMYKRDVVERSASFSLMTHGLSYLVIQLELKRDSPSHRQCLPVRRLLGSLHYHKTCAIQSEIYRSALITLFQVKERDGYVCRVTGVGSLSYWSNKPEEALEKNVGYGCFQSCEVAHAIPWSVDQPVRNVYCLHAKPC